MPQLLAPGAAVPLDALLAQVDTAGLQVEIRLASGGAMPRLAGIGSLAGAGPSELSFLTNPKYQSQLARTRAGAVLLTPDVAATLDGGKEGVHFARVICREPYLLYARVSLWFAAQRRGAGSDYTTDHTADHTHVHPSAVVAPDARLAAGVVVGAHCVIESGVTIGRGTTIGPGCLIGAHSSIGADSVLHARVTLYDHVTLGARAIVHSGAVLGADGFGFAPDASLGQGAWCKIAQLGGVRVGDDVEIGANTTIDRGALEDTVIADGVKLDNQIMVAHNVHIGAHSAIAACVGIAGSTVIGARCTIGGAAMVSGHLTLADDVHISGGTAVIASIDQPGRYTGVYPASEHSHWQKNAAVVNQLAQLRRRLRALERAREQP